MNTENLYLTIINNLRDGVYFVDRHRRITLWNTAAEEITGYKREEILGKHCQSNLLNHIDRQGVPLCIVRCPLYSTLEDGNSREDEVYLRHKGGHRIPVKVRIFPIYQEGQIIGAVEIFTPSSSVYYEDDLVTSLTDLAMKDPLTGLSNRRYLESYIEYKLGEYSRFQSKFCVLFLDLDDFGSFNNLYGHDTGDAALRSISRSFQHSLRKSDLMGRWGGEEFLGVFDITYETEMLRIAEKIRMLVSSSEVYSDNNALYITASIGVAVVRDDDDLESIVNRADKLMYQSKSRGKDCVSVDFSR